MIDNLNDEIGQSADETHPIQSGLTDLPWICSTSRASISQDKRL